MTRNDITDSDALSCERKDDFTPGLNTDVEAGGLIMQAHTTTSTCVPQDGYGDCRSGSVIFYREILYSNRGVKGKKE